MQKISLKIPYAILKENHRQVRDQQTENAKIRIHRALSWLKNIDSLNEPDLIFIHLWISFNAAYADDFHETKSERACLKNFLNQIVELDRNKHIHNALFTKFSGPIRNLIDNKFAFEPFWKAMREHDSSDKWKEWFNQHKSDAIKVMTGGNTSALLSIILDRIYTLRNQLIHGGSTYDSSINRQQINDACQIMADLVPMILDIMIKNHDNDFGEIAYPVV